MIVRSHKALYWIVGVVAVIMTDISAKSEIHESQNCDNT